jgi:hypothetical protein
MAPSVAFEPPEVAAFAFNEPAGGFGSAAGGSRASLTPPDETTPPIFGLLVEPPVISASTAREPEQPYNNLAPKQAVDRPIRLTWGYGKVAKRTDQFTEMGTRHAFLSPVVPGQSGFVTERHSSFLARHA